MKREPLSIWFFVGAILVVFGVIVVLAGLVGDVRRTVLAETRPNLWWGAVMIGGGLPFLIGGLKLR